MKECDHVWKARIDKKNNYIFYFCVKCKESNKPSAGRHLCAIQEEKNGLTKKEPTL